MNHPLDTDYYPARAKDRLAQEIERVNQRERQWARKQKERARRQERLVWLITAVLFAFIAVALWCGPAANL